MSETVVKILSMSKNPSTQQSPAGEGDQAYSSGLSLPIYL